jgi:hypothetical protein
VDAAIDTPGGRTHPDSTVFHDRRSFKASYDQAAAARLPGDADAGADGQPLEAPADVGWLLLELLFDGTSPLAEVGPALVVEGG